MYKNWKISKEEYKKSLKVQSAYAMVARWCNETGQYYIEDEGDYYVVKENPLYVPISERDLKTEMLSAQLADTVSEDISPTTFLNVMIKL